MTFTVKIASPTYQHASGYITLIKSVLRENPPVDTPYAPDEFDPPVEAIQARIAHVADLANSLFLVAESKNKVIGALTCGGGSIKADFHRTELGVYVAKSWRDKGVGSALMARAIAWAQASHVVQRVELEVFAANDRAIHVYEKFGFEREGVKRGLYKRGDQLLDMVIMARLFAK